jgi:hypothetical protein
MTNASDAHSAAHDVTVAILWRGDPQARGKHIGANNRLRPIADALSRLGARVDACVFSEDVLDDVRAQLMSVDGVLVWVDPIDEGRDRSALDPLLREAGDAGVWVSAHPDVIMKMGVKEALYRTRDLGWGVDTDLYPDFDDFLARFPGRLAGTGPRVLKQNRGNGGIGVWKVDLISGGDDAGAVVRVLQARRGSSAEEMRLTEFMKRCEVYFANAGRIVDQAFAPRLPEGMIRCYLSQNKVVGFGRQLIKALVALPDDAPPEAATPGPRIMHAAHAPAFQALRARMEADWVPGLQRLLEIDATSLPVLWDADFLLGPKTATGEDTYVLCEINVSAVAPFPDQAPEPVARATVQSILAVRRMRASNA